MTRVAKPEPTRATLCNLDSQELTHEPSAGELLKGIRGNEAPTNLRVDGADPDRCCWGGDIEQFVRFLEALREEARARILAVG
jgi:hypothetical protein